MQKRHKAEVARHDQRIKAEQQAAGSRRDEMLRRQHAERQALQAEHERQGRVLGNRQAHERTSQAMAMEKAKPESRQPRERAPKVKSAERPKPEQGRAQ